MLTNASKRRGESASKRKQTRANVDKRKQTLTPLFIAVFHTPLAHFSYAIIVVGGIEPKCSKCYDRKVKIAFKSSKSSNR